MALVSVFLDLTFVFRVSFLILKSRWLMLDVIFEMCLSWFRLLSIVYPSILALFTCLTLLFYVFGVLPVFWFAYNHEFCFVVVNFEFVYVVYSFQ